MSCLHLVTPNKNKLMWLCQYTVHCSAPLSVMFSSINCNPSTTPFSGNRMCFPSQVWFFEQHRGTQETLPCFWLSSSRVSLYVPVCPLYLLCLFLFSTTSRLPATDPDTGQEEKPKLVCPGLQNLCVNTKYVIPRWCSTKKLRLMAKSDSRSFFSSVQGSNHCISLLFKSCFNFCVTSIFSSLSFAQEKNHNYSFWHSIWFADLFFLLVFLLYLVWITSRLDVIYSLDLEIYLEPFKNNSFDS